MTTATNNQIGIKFVTDSSMYPSYIKDHAFFHKISKIKKVFPSIGLPNTTEEIEYAGDNVELRSAAQNLIYNDIRATIADTLPKVPHNSPIHSVLTSVYNELAYNYARMAMLEDNKISIKLINNIIGPDAKILFKLGESLFKVYNKIIELCKENNIQIRPLEEMAGFKSFSSLNIPGKKKFQVVFSSDGEKGLWDISTISMRGINSCQTWETPQSHGLIGSMSSKYVGVIYLTNGVEFNSYGTKMFRRALVRFGIHTETKKPALLVDRIYPSDDPNVRKMFATFLAEKTNLPVLFAVEAATNAWSKYRLPLETHSWKIAPLSEPEKTYMDTKIPWMIKPIIGTSLNINDVANRLAVLDAALHLGVHEAISKMAQEYLADKKTHKEQLSGGVINLFASLETNIGGRSYIAGCLPQIYAMVSKKDSKLPLVTDFKDANLYERALIRTILLDGSYIKKVTASSFGRFGKMTKSFPKSIDKLINLLWFTYKQELMKRYKNYIAN